MNVPEIDSSLFLAILCHDAHHLVWAKIVPIINEKRRVDFLLFKATSNLLHFDLAKLILQNTCVPNRNYHADRPY